MALQLTEPVVKACKSGDAAFVIDTISKFETDEERISFVNQKDANGSSLIFHCSWNGHFAVMHALLEFGANPNIQNNRANTALHLCCEQRHRSLIALLVRFGARLDLKNWDSKTALDMCPDLRQWVQLLPGRYAVEHVLKRSITPWIVNELVHLTQVIENEFKVPYLQWLARMQLPLSLSSEGKLERLTTEPDQSALSKALQLLRSARPTSELSTACNTALSVLLLSGGPPTSTLLSQLRPPPIELPGVHSSRLELERRLIHEQLHKQLAACNFLLLEQLTTVPLIESTICIDQALELIQPLEQDHEELHQSMYRSLTLLICLVTLGKCSSELFVALPVEFTLRLAQFFISFFTILPDSVSQLLLDALLVTCSNPWNAVALALAQRNNPLSGIPDRSSVRATNFSNNIDISHIFGLQTASISAIPGGLPSTTIPPTTTADRQCTGDARATTRHELGTDSVGSHSRRWRRVSKAKQSVSDPSIWTDHARSVP